MNLSLSFESEDGSSVNIVLAKPALLELGAAILPGIEMALPVLERISHLVRLKREATAEDEAEVKAAEENEHARTGRLWCVIGYHEGRWWRLTETPILSWERCDEILADRTFQGTVWQGDARLLRIVTLDEWQAFFDPSTAPPGVSAVLGNLADERVPWVLVKWNGHRWRPYEISLSLDAMLNEYAYLRDETPLGAVCSFANWQHSFRERNTIYAEWEPTWPLDTKHGIKWDERRQLWAVDDGLPEEANDKNRSVTGYAWVTVYHCGFANPPRAAAGKTEEASTQPSEPERCVVDFCYKDRLPEKYTCEAHQLHVSRAPSQPEPTPYRGSPFPHVPPLDVSTLDPYASPAPTQPEPGQ
jgi:hypothetical protein